MRLTLVAVVALLGSGARSSAQELPHVGAAGGLRLFVSGDHADPTLRVVRPGRPDSDRGIEVIFPEHVTAVRRGSTDAAQLYLWRPGLRGDRPAWRRVGDALEYERELPGGIQLLARATLESDGIRFHYEFRNASAVPYDMIYAVTDPRMAAPFRDERLERTYVHHAGGFELLASETPRRLTMPLDEWLPARYLVSYTWPVPTQLVDRRADGITYYNKSRAVDEPFIATVSSDSTWIVASFAREVGNVWSNPELTCQHVDPQISLPAGGRAVVETKLLVLRGTLDDALRRARQHRRSLK